ncbi:MAG: DsbC family protein [Geobacteraceae bacterium]
MKQWAFLLLAYMLLAPLAAPAVAMSQQGCGGDCASCHSLSDKEAGDLLKNVGTVKAVGMAPVRGLFELTLEKDGRHATAYIDYGKKHLITGPIFDIASGRVISPLPVNAEKKPTNVDIAKIPLDNALIMGNPKGTKKLFVFTDPECPFCVKLHTELKKLVAMESALTIYIKLYPLKMHPKAYDKARVILGANSLELLERAFSGSPLPPPGTKDTAKPVDDSIRFAESVGINSTPTLIFPDGRIMPGFQDAEAMRKLLR